MSWLCIINIVKIKLTLQKNIWNVIYLNYGERYEDIPVVDCCSYILHMYNLRRYEIIAWKIQTTIAFWDLNFFQALISQLLNISCVYNCNDQLCLFNNVNILLQKYRSTGKTFLHKISMTFMQCDWSKMSFTVYSQTMKDKKQICWILTVANTSRSSPSSFFILLKELTMALHGPHHAE